MICTANRYLSRESSNYRRKQLEALEIFNLLKECEGLKWLQETEEKEFDIEYSWFDVVQIRITQEIEPDKLCSIAGEIEDILNVECEVEPDINEELVTYIFKKEYRSVFKIILRHPVCRFLVETEETEYYKADDVKSRKKIGRMVCD